MKNVFDNETFFAEYTKLRESDVNYNDLLEQPAMRALLPQLSGKSVLDIGCGFGKNCREFLDRGAAKVTGIDISEKMLAAARKNNAAPNILYRHLDMGKLAALDGTFDVVYSSLAFHYCEDFDKLMRDIAALLNPNGILLFSQEHPLTTADGDGHFQYGSDGKADAYILSGYSVSGSRECSWFIDHVEKTHRTFSDIINALCGAGLSVDRLCEPVPDAAALEKCPKMYKEFIKPSFLLIKAHKPER